MAGKPSRATQQKRQKALNDVFEHARQSREITELKKQLAEKDARIAELEAALTPFAEAAGDEDVKTYVQGGSDDCGIEIAVPIVGKTYVGKSNRYVYILRPHQEILRVRHLVNAAEALKGKSE